jgi:hypothetical protein
MSQLLESIEVCDNTLPAEPAILESAAIRADGRRILNALTLPEYIDVWMYMPDTVEFLCTSEPASSRNIRFDLYSSRGQLGTIHARRLASTPDHVMYIWKKTQHGITSETVLDIRLKFSEARCTLELRHIGFSSTPDYQWHAAMWKQSLANLSSLMERVGKKYR